MMILGVLVALFVGAGLGFLVSRRIFQKKLHQQVEEATRSLKAENEMKDKELMILKQSLADASYRNSELEKDCRSLQQQIDRLKSRENI